MTSETKVCLYCLKEKPLTEFNRRVFNRKSGVQWAPLEYCKTCAKPPFPSKPLASRDVEAV